MSGDSHLIKMISSLTITNKQACLCHAFFELISLDTLGLVQPSCHTSLHTWEHAPTLPYMGASLNSLYHGHVSESLLGSGMSKLDQSLLIKELLALLVHQF